MRAVITFHHLGDDRGPLAFPASAFDAMLRAFASSGLPVVDLDALLAPGAGPGVSLAFDDGWHSVLTRALPVLASAGVRAHLFLCTGVVAGDVPPRARMPAYAPLDWAGVERLHRGGVAIESHTHAHPDLRGLGEVAVDAECERSDALIERRVGRRPRYFAYPYGRHDAPSRRVAASRYAAAFTMRLSTLGDRDDRCALPRLDAHYLRSAALWRRIDGPSARAQFALRRALRALRGR
jgi:peptidoglycan/xylan/chitin deacetylase (PgdA/CDA1 family)